MFYGKDAKNISIVNNSVTKKKKPRKIQEVIEEIEETPKLKSATKVLAIHRRIYGTSAAIKNSIHDQFN